MAALDVPLWTQLFSLNAPALTQALETLEDNLRLYRQVIQSGDTRQLADKLAFSAARKRKMNQLEQTGATGRAHDQQAESLGESLSPQMTAESPGR